MQPWRSVMKMKFWMLICVASIALPAAAEDSFKSTRRSTLQPGSTESPASKETGSPAGSGVAPVRLSDSAPRVNAESGVADATNINSSAALSAPANPLRLSDGAPDSHPSDTTRVEDTKGSTLPSLNGSPSFAMPSGVGPANASLVAPQGTLNGIGSAGLPSGLNPTSQGSRDAKSFSSIPASPHNPAAKVPEGLANLPAMVPPSPFATPHPANDLHARGAIPSADPIPSQTMQAATWNTQGRANPTSNPSGMVATQSQEPRRSAPEPWEQAPSQQGSKATNPSTPRRVLGTLGPVRIVQANPDSQPTNVTSGRPRSAPSHPMFAEGWKRAPVRAGQDDREALVRPSLQADPALRDESFERPTLPMRDSSGTAIRSIEETSAPKVRYQSPSFGPGNIVSPNPMTNNPGAFVPPGPVPGSSSILPNNQGSMPSPQYGPSGINSTVMPQGGFSSPTNPSNLPRYNPRVVNGAPFVSEPPCQFDAYDMVHPANYMQSYPGCGPSVLPGAPPPGGSPYTYVPPTVTPNMAPGLYSSDNAGWRPLFTLGQENYNAQIGRGIIGQPTAYVPGQPFRNFLRYMFP